jgi:hypothetical protein
LRSKLVMLLFAGGGPLDGQELKARWPVDAEFAMDGSRYRLYNPKLPERRGDQATALYWWAPRGTDELEAHG